MARRPATPPVTATTAKQSSARSTVQARPAMPPVMQGLIAARPAPPPMPPGPGLRGALPGLAGGQQFGMGGQRPPSYQMGGEIGPQGMPIRPAGMQMGARQGPMNPQMMEMQLQEFAAQNPQVVQQIRQAIEQGVMSGEVTPQELSTLGQLAQTVMQDPNLYPQIRQFAIQQGIATEQDLPMQYDEGLVIAVLLAVRAMRANTGGQNMVTGGRPVQSMEDGGRVRGEASEPVMIEAHTGEYVIPKHVVDMKGREFFDRMLEQYSDRKDAD